MISKKIGSMAMIALSVAALVGLWSIGIATNAMAAPSWLQVGQPVPDQFTFSGEIPSIEEVRDAFIRVWGNDPEKWPEEFRRIHEIQVAFNKRAMSSSKFKEQFGRDALEKIKVQREDPVGYWVRSLYDGWGFEEWFNSEHLTVQRVPRALLVRFLEELFPLMWRDIRSSVHVLEFMLGLPDSKFIPYNNYDSQVNDLRKRDVLEYNQSIEKTAERYIRNNDYLMLLLMPDRMDTNWVGDAGFEASLVSRARKLSAGVQEVLKNMGDRFRAAFYEAIPRMTYSWNEEPWSENHVVIGGAPSRVSANVDLLGKSTRIEHPYLGDKKTIKEQKVASGGAMKLQWGTAPVHSSEFDRGAVVEKISPRYLIVRKQYGESSEFVLSLYLDHISGFGHEVAFTPAEGPSFPDEIGKEMMEAVTAAFFEAAEILYGESSGRTTLATKDTKSVSPPRAEPGEQSRIKKIVIDPPKSMEIIVSGKTNEGTHFNVEVWDERERIPQVEVSVKKPVIGTLSSRNATGGDEKRLIVKTGPLGYAEITYTPPSIPEMKLLGIIQKDIRIVAEDPRSGVTSSMSLRVSRPKDIDISLEHSVLPADPAFTNAVDFRFDGWEQGGDPEEKYRVRIRALSGKGVLSPGGDPSGGRSSLVLELKADQQHRLFYRWMGEGTKGGPVPETLVFEVPELEIKGFVNFSVGFAPGLYSSRQSYSEVEQPGLFVPLQVYVQDEYHPDLDMSEFFRAFELTPVLDISQIGFEPVATEGSKSREILEDILKHVKGAKLPKDVLSLKPESWSLMRGSGSRWFIVGETVGEGVSQGKAFPGIIPWEYGDYTFRISMNLEGPSGEAIEPLRQTMTRILHVRPFESGVSEGQAEMILPMILSFSAMFPGEDAQIFAARGRNLLQRGEFETAAVVLGENFSQRLSWQPFPEQPASLEKERLRQLVSQAHGVTGAAVPEETVGDSLSLAKQNFLCTVAGVYAENFLSWGYDLSLLIDSPQIGTDRPELRLLEMIKGFLEGYGEYGIVAITRKNIESFSVYTETGERLREFGGQVFGGGSQYERIFCGEHSIVVPFRLGENLVVTFKGTGDPVEAIKILPNGINVQRYGSRPGSETINVYGDVVRP